MTLLSGVGYIRFDATLSGMLTSLATAVGGPLIEVGLISSNVGYHYTDMGETGFFPLWICPVYFLGGPAVGNLARGIWNTLDGQTSTTINNEIGNSKTIKDKNEPNCVYCNDTRAVGCPNCDALGYYTTYNIQVKCNCCKGRGYVICRDCFNDYGEDPGDIESIRDLMSRMPD